MISSIFSQLIILGAVRGPMAARHSVVCAGFVQLTVPCYITLPPRAREQLPRGQGQSAENLEGKCTGASLLHNWL